MAAQNPPYALQTGSHSAELFRRAAFALAGQLGCVGTGDLKVSQHSTPAMSVDVAAGQILIPGSLATYQGNYYGLNDAIVTPTIGANGSGNPRLDAVCATGEDAQYAGAVNDWKIQVIQGTPAGSPSLPSLPSNSILLASVAVASGAASIVNANITDGRIYATSLGATLLCANSSAYPTNKFIGMSIIDLALTQELIWDGTVWQPAGQFARSWTFVAEANLVADGAISFTAIPQTFTHLMIVGNVRSTAGAANDALRAQFNADTGANYDYVWVRGETNTPAASYAVAGTSIYVGVCATAANVANVFSPITLYLPNYRSTNMHKHGTADTGCLDVAAAQTDSYRSSFKWRSTAAVTRIDLLDTALGTSFKAGSRVTLLGMR